MNPPIQLGLCCLNTKLRESKPTVFMSRSMVQKTLEKPDGIKVAKERSLQNIADIKKMIDWNIKNNINVMRLSSNIFPHLSNWKVTNGDTSIGVDDFREYQSLEWCRPQLEEIGKYARDRNHRLTFHPGQYNQVGAKTREVYEKTILDLGLHAKIFDIMGQGADSIMVIHGGGVYGNKTETIDRWKRQFMEMPQVIRDRLVFENCEKSYCIEDIIPISENLNIPIVHDTHHYTCYKHYNPDYKQKAAKKLMLPILETWRRRGIKPKFHISEQGSGKVGHHSDYVEEIPKYLLKIKKKHDIDIDIMIEAKMKEQAVLKLHDSYPRLLKHLKKKKKKTTSCSDTSCTESSCSSDSC
tara:strand:- start:1523 stop:2584 length:1062 start_codon:yes stop_codon:yes gene_type:complete